MSRVSERLGNDKQWTAGGDFVGVGWMAVDARKFKNGSLCEQTGYVYSTVRANNWGVTADAKACGSGTYYSYGIIAAWNGSSYDYYYSQKSPSLNG